jgi:hypothetical protein
VVRQKFHQKVDVLVQELFPSALIGPGSANTSKRFSQHYTMQVPVFYIFGSQEVLQSFIFIVILCFPIEDEWEERMCSGCSMLLFIVELPVDVTGKVEMEVASDVLFDRFIQVHVIHELNSSVVYFLQVVRSRFVLVPNR